MALTASCGALTNQASALEVWWAPAPARLQGELANPDLEAVGERVEGTQCISQAKMDEIRNAIETTAPLEPVAERTGEPLYPHAWPVGATGMPRVIYVPMSAPAPVGERVIVTRRTIEPAPIVRTKRIVYTTQRLEPVGERVFVTRRTIEPARVVRSKRVIYRTRHLEPVGERVFVTRRVIEPAPIVRSRRIVYTTRRLEPVGERVFVTRRTIEPARVVRSKRIVYRTRHLEPVGERVIITRTTARPAFYNTDCD